MILIERKKIGLFLVLLVSTYLTIGVYALVLSRNAVGLTATDFKYNSETMFFLVLLSFIVTMTLFAFIVRKSRKVFTDLDQLIESDRFLSGTPFENLKRLGELGTKLTTLYRQINAQNERSALKISTLSGVIEFFLRNTPMSIILLDVMGNITGMSNRYRKATGTRWEHNEASTIWRNVPGFDFQEVFSELRNSRSSVERDYGDTHLIFTPVFNRANEIATIICTFGHEDIMRGPVFSAISTLQ